MAESIGVVTGIVSLLPLCRDGFVMIKDVVAAKGKMAEQLTRIETHHSHFVSWSEVWGDERSRDAQFRKYEEEHPISAKDVLRQLALFSRLFYDLKALEKYGFTVKTSWNESVQGMEEFRFESDEDLSVLKIEQLKTSCNHNFSVMKKVKFVLGNREKKLEDLINRLREYNEVLWRYGPGVAVTSLDKGIYDEISKIMGDQLKAFFEAYTKESESARNPASAKRYADMAKLANFRSQVRQHEGATRPMVLKPHQFYIMENYAINDAGTSTLALLYNYPAQNDRRVALIEWIQNPWLPGKGAETEKLAVLLSTPKPEEMLIPGCYGVYDDLEHGRLGIVLKPPRNIRAGLPVNLPSGAVSVRRRPVSLRYFVADSWAGFGDVDLGTKFGIAKKLVDTVHLMHAAEWVHKNIRSESILFFPKGAMNDSTPIQGGHARYDFTHPYLVGFNTARSDQGRSNNETGHQYPLTPVAQAAARNLTMDYYQHPAKVANPSLPYERFYDLYSLGVVLLELGAWRSLALDLSQGHHPYDVMNRIRGLVTDLKIGGKMGSIYAGVVTDCLALGLRSSLDDPARFGTDIASRLAQCVA